MSYIDPAKQESRTKLREFIRTRLENPKQARVVCFPGAEKEGEEALEVKEIYDRLGIPRENIFGLEYDKEKADRLKKADLNIQVINASDLEFFRDTDQKFDVISLDYTGHQNREETTTLENIAGRHLLTHNGILFTNYAAKRESKNYQALLFHRYLSGVRRGRLKKDIRTDSTTLDRMIKDVLEGNSPDIPLSELRDSTTPEILRAFRHGSFCIEKEPDIFRMSPIYDMVNRKLLSIYNQSLRRSKQMIQAMVDQGIVKNDWRERLRKDPTACPSLYFRMHSESLAFYIHQITGIPEQLSHDFSDFLTDRWTQPYTPAAIERYSYTSNKNMTMNIDMFQFTRHPKEFERFSKVLSINAIYSPPRIVFNIEDMDDAKLKEEIKEMIIFVSRLYNSSQITERINLGSSYRRKEKISKEDAIELLKTGCTTEEIAETYSGLSIEQLAAFKAHISMGKY